MSEVNGQTNGAMGGLQVRQHVGVLRGGKIPQDGRVATELIQAEILEARQVGPLGKPFNGIHVGQPLIVLTGVSAAAQILTRSGKISHVIGGDTGNVVFGLQL